MEVVVKVSASAWLTRSNMGTQCSVLEIYRIGQFLAKNCAICTPLNRTNWTNSPNNCHIRNQSDENAPSLPISSLLKTASMSIATSQTGLKWSLKQRYKRY